MLGLMFRLLGSVLAGVCLAALGLILSGLAALLRLLPRLTRLGLRGFLILSFRLYHLLLTRVAPGVEQHLNVKVLAAPSRVVACFLLSLVLGLSFLLLTNLPVTGWGVGLSLLHGLAVGLAWDEIEKPGGLQLGVKIE